MGATSSARQARRRKGLATYRMVRYADDFVIVVHGTREHASKLREEVATVLQDVGLQLSEEKTHITHIDTGFDFLGFRIQRRRNRSDGKRYVYTWPSRKSLRTIMTKTRAITRTGRDHPLRVILYQLNRALRGWANYFRHGVSKSTFDYLRAFTWRRTINWIRRKHPRTT